MKKLTLSIGICLSVLTIFSCNKLSNNKDGSCEANTHNTSSSAAAKNNELCQDCNSNDCLDEHAAYHLIDSLKLDSMLLKTAGGIRYSPKIYTGQQIQSLIAQADCANDVLVCRDDVSPITSNSNIELRIDEKMAEGQEAEGVVQVYYTIFLFKALMRMNPAKFYFYNAYDYQKSRKDIVFEVLDANDNIIYFGDLSGTYPPLEQ
ncbi:MAG: hypothetical protein J0L80_07420 [Chitinophagales bacterium]|nr:hypothetical protein [Chitinophagales bacterium]